MSIFDGGNKTMTAGELMRMEFGPPTTWNEKLGCFWREWHVVGDGDLVLKLPPHNCTDMRGAIAVAKSLMPDVWRIAVYAGEALDIVYLNDRGKWTARDERARPSGLPTHGGYYECAPRAHVKGLKND